MEKDWESIKISYEGSSRSIRAIGRSYDVSDTAIRKKAKSENWKRYTPPVEVRNNDPQTLQPHRTILGKVALRKIDEIVKELGDHYNPVDEPMVVMYAKTYERYLDLEKKVSAEGETCVSSKGSSYLNPTFNALQMTIKNLSTLGDRLGLSIASRKKLNLNLTKEEKTKSLFDLVDGLSDMDDVDV